MQRFYGVASVLLAVGLGLFAWRMLQPPAPAPEIAATAEAAPPTPSGAGAEQPDVEGLRVLFVGNSHTYYNDMPKLVAQLAAEAGDRPLVYEQVVTGGARLADHVKDGKAAAALTRGHFEVMVLQEQQQFPSFSDEQRKNDTDAPAQALSLQASANGTQTVLMMVWARRDGDPQNVPNDTFGAMHERTVHGHTECARTIGAKLAPAAVAWKRAHDERPDLVLWAADGYHPALAGSYLAACVMYRVLYGKSPAGNAFTAGLPSVDAAYLQDLAASTVSG